MSIETLVDKYIAMTEKALKYLKQIKDTPIKLEEENITEILAYVRTYLQDAKYYREQKKFETSLTSIAYCEGLIDALKIMGAIEILSAT